MTLTQKDQQTIKKLLNEQKDELKHELKHELKEELGLELKQNTNILKIHMDVEFRKMDAKLEQVIKIAEESKINIVKVGEVLEDHETRIITFEHSKAVLS